jgi:S-methylmethionine-dependent homocysteine/selenocysteine methylase
MKAASELASSGISHVLGPRPFLLLDGAVGTELALRGVDMQAALDDTDVHDDYWSGKALLTDPNSVQQLHEDYLNAGADLITTNTFRVNRPVVLKMSIKETAELLLERGVALATAARAMVAPHSYVGGSVGPIASCYSPELTPNDAQLHLEHRATIEALVNAGVDVLLLETMSNIREAKVASSEAAGSGVPFITSFSIRPRDSRLYSGEEIVDAVNAILPLSPLAILVNHCHPDLVEPALRLICAEFAGSGVWFGARAHLDKPTPENSWQYPGNCSVPQYVEYAYRWLAIGATVIGGCCGTTPAYISGLAEMRAHHSALI